MAKFYYARTKKVVDIPDDRAAEYERRRWYTRLPTAADLRVPEGSVPEILAWVGDDGARRMAALQAEREGKGRVTLIAALSED